MARPKFTEPFGWDVETDPNERFPPLTVAFGVPHAPKTLFSMYKIFTHLPVACTLHNKDALWAMLWNIL